MYETLVENEPHHWHTTFDAIVREQQLDTTADRLWHEWRNIERNFRENRIKPGAPFQTYYDAWRDCFIRAFRSMGLPGDADAAIDKSMLSMSQRAPYPETKEALAAVQELWRTAVLSNADDDYLLPNLKLLDLEFVAVLSSEAARCYKPQPELFQEMLRRLDVAPEACAYVGDRQFEDVKGAGQVGMHTVWINRTGNTPDPELPTPEFQIASLLQLPDILISGPTVKANR